MAIKSIPVCAPTRVAASGAVSAVPGRVFAVLLAGGSSNTKVVFTNDANGSGTAVFEINAPYTKFLDFIELGGIDFSSKCYATFAGSDGIAYIWYA